MINEKMITDKKMIEHMKPIITRHYEDMFLKNASTGGSFAVTVGSGGAEGFLIGYFLRKILKLILFVLGGILTLLAYLQYQRLITMNMDKIQNYFDKVTSSLPNSISVIIQKEYLHLFSFGMNDLAIMFTGSVAVGITAGFFRG